ncbi:uncharacterized protein LOC124551220 isoform X1 [Schistocerca americana]|uniref:uncharacterized protein LOC124551220 isoform X1 n=1 Tax=Schistocerca americana TaxID=7009 RepID=UPI001F4F79C3|nr:uncharacterized protein LOC124551220 isoform X1 [Schistocerca americana]
MGEVSLANSKENLSSGTRSLCCNNLSHSSASERPNQKHQVLSEEDLSQSAVGSNKQLQGIYTSVTDVSITNISYPSKQGSYTFLLSSKSAKHQDTNKEKFTTEIQERQNDNAGIKSANVGISMTSLTISQNDSVDNVFDNSDRSLPLHDVSKVYVTLSSNPHPTEEALFFDGDSEYAPTPLALPLFGLETSWSDSDRAEYVRRSVESFLPNDLSPVKNVHEDLIDEGNKAVVASQKNPDSYIHFQEGDGNYEAVKSKTVMLLPERHIGGYEKGYAINSTPTLSSEKSPESSQRLEDVSARKRNAHMLLSYNGSSSVSEVPFQRDVGGNLREFNTGRLERAVDRIDSSKAKIVSHFGAVTEDNMQDRSGIVDEIGSRKINAIGRNGTSTSSAYYNYRGGVKDEQNVRTDKFGHSIPLESVGEPSIVDSKSSEIGSTTTEEVSARRMAAGDKAEPSSLLEVEHMCRACSQVCHHTTAEIGSAGRVRCGCFRGYTVASDWQHCADVDECLVKDSVCQNGICLNTLGSFTCLCRPGYQQIGSDCFDIDECAIGAACDQLCINLPGSYQCWCRRGFTLSTVNRRLCVDLDECSLGVALCAGNCLNTFGSFICRCPPGATLHADGRTCIAKALESRDHSPHIVLHRGSTVQPPGEQSMLELPTARAGGSAHSALEKRKLHLETLHNVATLRSSTSRMKQNKKPLKTEIAHQTTTRRPNPKDGAHDEYRDTGFESVPPAFNTGRSSPVRDEGQVQDGEAQDREHRHLYGANGVSAERGLSASSKNIRTGDLGTRYNGNVGKPHFTDVLGPTVVVAMKTEQETEAADMFHINRVLSESQVTTELPLQATDLPTTKVSGVGSPKPSHQPQDELHQSTQTSASTGNTVFGIYSKHNKRRSCIPMCRNGGTCNTAAGACTCLAGFRGRYCQLDRNECIEEDRPCGSHLCVNAWGSYRCLCPAGYRTSAGGTSCVQESAWRDLHVANMVIEDRQPTPLPPPSAENVTTLQHFSIAAEREKSVTELTTVSPKLGTREWPLEELVKNGSASSENSADVNISSSNLKTYGPSPAILRNNTDKYSNILSEMLTYSFALYTNPGSRATTFATTSAVTEGAVGSNSSSSSSSHTKKPTQTTPLDDVSQAVTYTVAVVPKLYEHRFSNVSSVSLVKNMKNARESVQEYVSGEYTQSNKSNTNVHNSVPLINSASNELSKSSDASTLMEHSTTKNLSDPEIKFNVSHMGRNCSSSVTSNVYDSQLGYEPKSITSDDRNLNAEKNNAVNKTTIQSDKPGEHNLIEKDSAGSVQQPAVSYVAENSINTSDIGTASSTYGQRILHTDHKLVEHSGTDMLHTTLPSTDSEAQDFTALPTVTQKMELVREEQDTLELKIETQQIQKPDETKFKSIKMKKVRSSVEKMNKQTKSQEERSGEMGRGRMAASRPPESRMFLLEPLPTPTPTTAGTLPPLPTLGAPPQSGADCFFKYRRIPSGQSFYKDATNCTSCICRDSEVRCEKRQCPAEPLHCEEPVAGRCCRHCPQDCVLESGDVLLPGETWTSALDPCRVCRCAPGNPGRTVCHDVECPPPACPARDAVLVAGECCPRCPPSPGCIHRGRFLYEGQLWLNREHGCHSCLCKNGQVECSPVECTLQCYHPRLTPGECCPLCKGCQYGSRTYDDGQLFPHPSLPCTTCVCQQGNITCYPEVCPVANCSHPLLAPSGGGGSGSCCPRCLHCLLEGQRLLHGTSILLLSANTTCHNCSCHYGNVSCSPTPCETTSGCRLESGAVVPLGSQFWPAQDVCTVCRCNEGGRAHCHSADCPGPPCTHGVLLPDSCCLDCSKCDYRGELFEEKQVFLLKTDPCQSCSCAGGNVTCHNICGDSSAVRLPGD